MTPLEQKLQQLNLKAMSRQIEATMTEASARNLSISATIELLADLELEARQGRAIERRFKCSRLQSQPSIDAFHFHHHKSRVQAKNRSGDQSASPPFPGIGRDFATRRGSLGQHIALLE
jgi:DNA replication protein DnaC